jgi:hypothetical protein
MASIVARKATGPKVSIKICGQVTIEKDLSFLNNIILDSAHQPKPFYREGLDASQSLSDALPGIGSFAAVKVSANFRYASAIFVVSWDASPGFSYGTDNKTSLVH